MPEFALKILLSLTRARLLFALQLAVATVLALASALALGLPNAYWAAMTVWIVAQPTRGMMMERNLYRLIGTGIGSGLAFLLLALTKDSFAVISVLSLAIVACVGVGNLLSGSRSYGVLLIGYTMAIVILPDIGDLAHPHDWPVWRVAATVVGVLISSLVGALFAPRSPRRAFAARARDAGFDAFMWVADIIGGGGHENGDQYLVELERRLIREIADVESLIEVMAAGSPAAHRRMRFLRVFLLQLVNAMAIARTLAGRRLAGGEGGLIAESLRDLAEAIRTEGDTREAELKLKRACNAVGAVTRIDMPVLMALGGTVRQAMAALTDFTRDTSSLERMHYELHRDVPGAVRAALRTYLSFTAAAAIWLLTGWSGGPYTLMGMAIFLMVFSTFPQPQRALTGVFLGTLAGSAAALACRWAILHYAETYLYVFLILAPFIVVGALARSYPKTEKQAIDYGMTLFVVSQPVLPAHGGMELSFSIAWSMIAAIVIVIFAFQYLVPAKPGYPARDIEKALAEDLRQLAGGHAEKETGKRLTRMLHRALRLAALADARRSARLETVIAPISAAHAIRQLQAQIAAGSLPQPVAAESGKILEMIADKSATPVMTRDGLDDAVATLHRLRADPDTVATVEDIRAALRRIQFAHPSEA